MGTIKENDLNAILRFGLTEEKLNQFDILCLPENFITASNASELFDASDAINLSKFLKMQNLLCANSFDLSLESQILERRSSEKWFGVVLIRNKIILPVFATVIGGLILNRIDGRDESDQVHIELHLEKPEEFTRIKYDGDGETLIKVLDAIKDSPDSTSAK